jgi:outer membrane receptor protein involved in Fe transport
MKKSLLVSVFFLGLPSWVAAQEPAMPARRSTSALDPTYDVLLPDPEPAADTTAKSDGDRPSANTDIDIADRVLSAAKQVTTVQEAPSIVTVVRADEIQARGYRNITQVLENIPGWLPSANGGNLLPIPMVRGTAQAALLLRDGVSMFEPVTNVGTYNRSLPLETIKSIEVVTGPGGVLWGANSFLGIVNLISKDADDINGLEASAGYGDGPGSPQDFRAYVLFGKSFRFKRGPKLSIVQHVSYETYIAPRYNVLSSISRNAAPSPVGPHVYSVFTDTNPERSYIVNVDGKISLGPVTLAYSMPFALMNTSLSFANNPTSGRWDTATNAPAGEPVRNHLQSFDRFVTLQYKGRFLKDRLGLDIKAYAVEFVRDLDAVLLPGSSRNPSGTTFNTAIRSYRTGLTIDGDATLPLRNRLLWGGDLFYEWAPELTVQFPLSDPKDLPISCPLERSGMATPVFKPGCPLPFLFGTNRLVTALYLSDTFRPVSSLTLDAGVRLQGGFGQAQYNFGNLGNNGQILGSASLVWNFYRDMHLKANYASGFRPPVFNNTDSNGAAVQFSGSHSLKNERSDAFQGEWNAKLLRNIGPIRALQLRADYAYTDLRGLIVISNGSYTNRRTDSNGIDTGPGSESRRRIHSVESAARLFIGDHTLSANYTFLHITTNDRGVLRSMPQHSFNLGWVLSVIPGWLEQNGTLIVVGSYDDPNRLRTISLADGSTIANFSDLTFDRLPPQTILNLGARAHFFKNRLWASLNFYNVLNQRYYYPDPFYDLAPTLEVSPTPAPAWSTFFQLGGKPF